MLTTKLVVHKSTKEIRLLEHDTGGVTVLTIGEYAIQLVVETTYLEFLP